jgi:hypothetical protein
MVWDVSDTDWAKHGLGRARTIAHRMRAMKWFMMTSPGHWWAGRDMIPVRKYSPYQPKSNSHVKSGYF